MPRPVLLALVALLALAAPTSAAIRSGTYSGQTRQHLKIAVRIGAKGMRGASYRADYRCRRAGRSFATARQPSRLGPSRFKRGRIDTRQVARGDVARLVARRSGRRLVGWFSETYRTPGGATCSSGRVRFSLKR